jgi:hypothetical protein
MSKLAKPKEIEFELLEVVKILKGSDNHNWCKALLNISWQERESTIDIRTFNFETNTPGKGISLTDEEVDMMVDTLVERDYGSLKSLEKAIERKRNRFTVNKPKEKYRIETIE